MVEPDVIVLSWNLSGLSGETQRETPIRTARLRTSSQTHDLLNMKQYWTTTFVLCSCFMCSVKKCHIREMKCSNSSAVT